MNWLDHIHIDEKQVPKKVDIETGKILHWIGISLLVCWCAALLAVIVWSIIHFPQIALMVGILAVLAGIGVWVVVAYAYQIEVDTCPLPDNYKPDYKCQYCGESGITVIKKGFSLGKAVAGGLLLGPIGLVAGAHRANEVVKYCSNCGAQRY